MSKTLDQVRKEIRTFSAVAVDPENVDVPNGIIRGASIMQIGEARGHWCQIDSQTLAEVLIACQKFKNGVKVLANHFSGIEDVTGRIINFQIIGPKLIGDIHLFKSHEKYNYFLDLAQMIPDTFGLSCCFSGYTEPIGDEDYMRCEEIFSIDFVTEPAANPNGLFSRGGVDTQKKGMIKKALESDPAASTDPAVDLKPVMDQLASQTTVLGEVQTKLDKILTLLEADDQEDKSEDAATSKGKEEDDKGLQAKIDASVEKALTANATKIAAAAGSPPIAIAPDKSGEAPASAATVWNRQFDKAK